ncbi:MAG: di-heme oxidoredictase family protein [Gallionellaceae bacterium]|nr:di-heme oxidoredictase family protein [Gallionellaceae bacterium]
MYVIILALLCILAGVWLPKLYAQSRSQARRSMIVGGGVALLLLLWASCYVVLPGQVGHLQRVYFGASLPPGAILAKAGQNGPQLEVIGPGFHFIPFLKILYAVEDFPVVSVPSGQFAVLSAKDGAPLAASEMFAPAWPQGQAAKMLDAAYFLAHGGQKGVQLTVLTPGVYAINRYLFDVTYYPVLDVPAGFVAVVKSNVNSLATCASAANKTTATTTLVAQGCAGIWKTPLLPGLYNLNPNIFQATLIPTRAQSLLYSNSNRHNEVAIVRDTQGRILERLPSNDTFLPDEVMGAAIPVTVQGQRAQLELRLVMQINPNEAARLVAEVGDVRTLQREFLTPAIYRSAQEAVLARDSLADITAHPAGFERELVQKLRTKIRIPGVAVVSAHLLSADKIPPALLSQRAVPSYELSARVVAVGIPGAAGVRQVGFFHPGGPMRNNPAFRMRTRPGKILDPERVLVASLSNFGAPLGVANQSSGAVLSINTKASDALVIPADFATEDGQQSIFNGNVQLFAAQTPQFLNQINNPQAQTAHEPAISNPRYISINNAFGRPWVANAPSGMAGAGSSTVLDPTGEPLAHAPSDFAGGVFSGSVTNRQTTQYSQGDLFGGALGTVFLGASPDGTGPAVFAVIKADGSIVQVHVRDGVDGLAPPGTVSAVNTFNPALSSAESAGLIGAAFEWTPERILYVVDGPRNRIAALHLGDDGKHFVLRKIQYLQHSEFAYPVDLAATMPEIANSRFASHTTLAGRSDLYVLNRANATLLRINREGVVVARAALRIPNLSRAEDGRVAGLAVSEDGRKIWITLQGTLPQFPQSPGALIEVSAFDREGPLADRPNYWVVEKLDTPDAKLGKTLFNTALDAAHGLGPLFNGSSCASCHRYPTLGGMGINDEDFVVRIAHFDPSNGRFDTLVDRGGPIAHKHFLAGAGFISSPAGFPPQANITSIRLAPSLYGMADLDEISDEVISAQAVDKGDGVHGRVNMITDSAGVRRIGKYGWKADIAGLQDMIASALDNELGITNPVAEALKQHTQQTGKKTDSKGSLDDDGTLIHALKNYLRALALAPIAVP